MTQTLSPGDTGEILFAEDRTRDLTRLRNGPHPSPLPRADLADTVTLVEPMLGGFERATHPDTMPLPPPPPVPSGPQPQIRQAKVLVPLHRARRTPRYAKRRGLWALLLSLKPYRGKRRAGAR